MSFEFVANNDLRRIIERDYEELQRIKAASAPKSGLVLAGSLIEALLLAALKSDPSAPDEINVRGKSLNSWTLGDLIDEAVRVGLISASAQSFGHAVREYRNLVHPGREIKSKYKAEIEEAEIAEKVLEIVVRDLRKLPRER